MRLRLHFVEIGLGLLALTLIALIGFLPRPPAPSTASSSADSEQGLLPAEPGQAFYGQPGIAWNNINLARPPSLINDPPAPDSGFAERKQDSPLAEPAPPNQATDTPSLLELPQVLESELSIGQDGLRSFAEYAEYIGANGQKVSFPTGRYQALISEYPGSLPLPPELVASGLKSGEMTRVLPALELYREFLQNKIEFFKTIRVAGDMVELNRRMIAIDRLTLELLDNALAAAAGQMSLAELEDFNARYNNTIAAERQAIKSKFGNLLADASQNFISRALQFLDLVPVAKALGLGFGGNILYVERFACSCTGMLITVGPPVAGEYMLYWAVYASPAIFLYKNISETAFILGNYLPGAGYCAPPPFCIGVPGFSSITIAGTS